MWSEKNFDREYFSGGIYSNYKRIILEWVPSVAKKIHQIVGRDGRKLLDIGCAHGYLMAELQNKYNFIVKGLEISPYAIKRAEPSVRKKIKKGDFLKTFFKRDSFDIVICLDMVNYLSSFETMLAIKKMVRISKDYIFFSAIFRNSRWASQKFNPDKYRITNLCKKDYIQFFKMAGAGFIKGFQSQNGGEILVFKKIKNV